MEEKHPRENTEKFETTKAVYLEEQLTAEIQNMKTINKETESEFYYMLQIANVLPLGTVKK
jgi:hypothetical protein